MNPSSVPGQRAVRPLLMCGVAATLLVASACSQALRLPPAPPATEIPDLERRITENATDLQVLTRLGAAYWSAGRLDEAERTLLRASDLDSRHPAPAFFLGVTYEEMERWSEARQAFERYLELGEAEKLQAAVRQRLVLLQRREVEEAVRASLAEESGVGDRALDPAAVGLFPFLYTGPDEGLRPLGRALAELLSNDLSRTDRLRVVERVRVQLLLDEIALGQSGAVDASTAARAGNLLGAGRMVGGSVDGGEESLLLEAMVLRLGAGPGGDPSTLSDRDPLRLFFDLQKRMALDLYASLGVELTPAEREQVTQRPTENIQALLAFGEGLEAGDGGRFAAAAGHFAEAARLDPGFEEAVRRGEEAVAMDMASRTSTRRLALSDDGDLMTEPTQEDWDRLQVSLRDMWFYLPVGQHRDPVSEITGTEGFGLKTLGSVEFIFRRP
jgi:tetratricopeptide (TPR) repeat protein